MNPPAAPRARRIVLALESAGDEATLAAAIELAARLEAELEGLLVDDPDFVRAAMLPFSRALDPMTGHATALDLAAVLAQAERLAGETAARLSQLAGARRVRASFRVARGPARETLQQASIEAELVVLPQAASLAPRGLAVETAGRRAARALPRPVLHVPPGADPAGPVTAVIEPGPLAERVLAWAMRLAGPGPEPLDLRLSADDPAALAALEAEVRERLEQARRPARIRHAAGLTPARLLRARHHHFGSHGVLVVADGSRFLAGEEPAAVAAHGDTALLLVR